MKKIGITGGIASGKSLVTDYLKSLGAKVICADEITHELYLPNEEGTKAIAKEFGEEYIDENGVDRKKLGMLVFGDRERLSKLNELIHPLVFSEIENRIGEEDDVVFFDAALLIESGMHKGMDEVWLVVTNLYERIKRLKIRDNLDDETIDRIIGSQMDDIEKSRVADRIIDNSFTREETLRQVKRIYEKILEDKV